jgi:hypothetical protein
MKGADDGRRAGHNTSLNRGSMHAWYASSRVAYIGATLMSCGGLDMLLAARWPAETGCNSRLLGDIKLRMIVRLAVHRVSWPSTKRGMQVGGCGCPPSRSETGAGKPYDRRGIQGPKKPYRGIQACAAIGGGSSIKSHFHQVMLHSYSSVRTNRFHMPSVLWPQTTDANSVRRPSQAVPRVGAGKASHSSHL